MRAVVGVFTNNRSAGKVILILQFTYSLRLTIFVVAGKTPTTAQRFTAKESRVEFLKPLPPPNELQRSFL